MRSSAEAFFSGEGDWAKIFRWALFLGMLFLLFVGWATDDVESIPSPRKIPIARMTQSGYSLGPVKSRNRLISSTEKEFSFDSNLEYERALLLLENSDIESALKVLLNIIDKFPTHVSALTELGELYTYHYQNPQKGIPLLKRAIENDADNERALSGLINSYLDQDNLSDGVDYLKQLASKNPQSYPLSMALGDILSTQGQFSEAIQYFERAVSQSDRPSRALEHLAEAYLESGDSGRAVESYERALEMVEREMEERVENGYPAELAQEKLARTKLELAYSYFQHNDFEAGERILEEIESLLPLDDPSLKHLKEEFKLAQLTS